MARTQMKCAYKYCKHGGTVEKDDAIRVNTQYWHPDCLKEKNDMLAVIDLFKEQVDAFPIFTQLRKIVNDIVWNHGVDAGFLLFALQYAIKSGYPHSKNPAWLYYVVKDRYALEAWKRQQAANAKTDYKDYLSEQEVKPEIPQDQPSFIPPKATSFEDILR